MESIAVASFCTEDGISKVIVPITKRLSVTSVTSTLERFKNHKLLNVAVLFTDDAINIEFIFQNPSEKQG